MLNTTQAEGLGQLVADFVEVAIAKVVKTFVLARTVRIGTTSVLGFAPFRNLASPNGDTISNGEAAVWLGGEESADNYIWCPVRRGLSVSEGDVVRVVRDSVVGRIWRVDDKL